MARIIYGSIITDIKGSIGGITFQKNGSGTIARLKPRQTKTNTQKQRDQQPRLKEIQREWNELSLANKILWNDFASVNDKIGLDGQPKKLTGYQWFLTINENRLLFEDSILESPPVYEIVNPINSLGKSYFAGILSVYSTPASISGNYKWLLYASFVLNSASKFDFNPNRLVRILNVDDITNRTIATPVGANYWNGYFNSNFPPNVNNKPFYIFLYVRAISKVSGISSMAYTTIAKFVWDGSKYVIET